MATKKKFYGKDFQKKMDELKGGHKGVELTKGNRLPHGYEIVKGADKNHDYSQGKKKVVSLKKGYRLAHGYVATKGAKNKKYKKGGVLWEASDISNAKYLGIIEFQDNEEEFHNFEVMETEDRLIFGGMTNSGFIESGYIEKDGFSTDEVLQELVSDLETYYNDGEQYTSMIVFNERMAKGGNFIGKQKNLEKGGHKGVELTKGNRLPHGYEIVKGADKNHDYSQGKKKVVGLKKGYRLAHGYVATKGAKNKKYEDGGGLEDEALALRNKYKGTSEYKEVASISDSLNFIKNHISIGKTEQTADLAGTIRTEILFDKKLVGYYDINRNEDSYIYAISKEKTKNAKGVFVKKSVENPHSLSKGTGYAKYKYFVFSNYKMSIDEDVFEDAITDMIRNKYKYEDGGMMAKGGKISDMTYIGTLYDSIDAIKAKKELLKTGNFTDVKIQKVKQANQLNKFGRGNESYFMWRIYVDVSDDVDSSKYEKLKKEWGSIIQKNETYEGRHKVYADGGMMGEGGGVELINGKNFEKLFTEIVDSLESDFGVERDLAFKSVYKLDNWDINKQYLREGYSTKEIAKMYNDGDIISKIGYEVDNEDEEYANGGRLTTNEDLIKSFLTTKDNKKVGNLLTKYNSETDEVFLINYSTIIAKKKKSQVTISTKKYSVTTTKIQNMIKRMAEQNGLIVKSIEEFANGGKIDLAKNERLVHGNEIIKAATKGDYSTDDVELTRGYRLPHGYETTKRKRYATGGGVGYKKDWQVTYITMQGKMGKKTITLGRISDKTDVKNALKRMDLNIREVTNIKEGEVYENGGGLEDEEYEDVGNVRGTAYYITLDSADDDYDYLAYSSSNSGLSREEFEEFYGDDAILDFYFDVNVKYDWQLQKAIYEQMSDEELDEESIHIIGYKIRRSDIDNIEDRLPYDEDGGMMARGGTMSRGRQEWVVRFSNQENGSWKSYYIMAKSEDEAIDKGFRSLTNDGEESDEYSVDSVYPLGKKNMMAKGGGVGMIDLERMINEYNEQGRSFELTGAYGNLELWSKGNRLEVGSKKDIYNALVKYRFNDKYAEGGGLDDLLEQDIISKIQYYPKGLPPKNHKYGVRYKGKTYTSNSSDDLVQKVLLETNKYAEGGNFGNSTKKNDKYFVRRDYDAEGEEYIPTNLSYETGLKEIEDYKNDNDYVYQNGSFYRKKTGFLAMTFYEKKLYAEGGNFGEENTEMVANQNKAIKHHTEELKKVLDSGIQAPAWVVAKVGRASNDLSDVTHYLDGEKMATGGGVGEEILDDLKYDSFAKGSTINGLCTISFSIGEGVRRKTHHVSDFGKAKKMVSENELNGKIVLETKENNYVLNKSDFLSCNSISECKEKAFDKFAKGSTIEGGLGKTYICEKDGRIEIYSGTDARSGEVKVGDTFVVTEEMSNGIYYLGKLKIKGSFKLNPGLSGKDVSKMDYGNPDEVIYLLRKENIGGNSDFFAQFEAIEYAKGGNMDSDEKMFCASISNRYLKVGDFVTENNLHIVEKQDLKKAIQENMDSYSDEGKTIAKSVLSKI